MASVTGGGESKPLRGIVLTTFLNSSY